MQGQLDRVLETVRDRPGSALLITAAGAALLGYLSGRLLYRAGSISDTEEDAEPPAASEISKRGYRPTTSSIPDSIAPRITDDSSLNSGTSTPQSSITGTPRKAFANELSGELETLYALVFRADLQIAKGKLATLATQAAIAQYKQLHKSSSPELKLWERGHKAKVCLQCSSEEQLLSLQDAAKEQGVLTFKVKDQIDGRRQTAVLAIGPAKGSIVKDLTNDLLLQP